MHWSQDSAALKLITLISEECLSMFKSSDLPSCQLHDDKNDILVKEKKKKSPSKYNHEDDNRDNRAIDCGSLAWRWPQKRATKHFHFGLNTHEDRTNQSTDLREKGHFIHYTYVWIYSEHRCWFLTKQTILKEKSNFKNWFLFNKRVTSCSGPKYSIREVQLNAWESWTKIYVLINMLKCLN